MAWLLQGIYLMQQVKKDFRQTNGDNKILSYLETLTNFIVSFNEG